MSMPVTIAKEFGSATARFAEFHIASPPGIGIMRFRRAGKFPGQQVIISIRKSFITGKRLQSQCRAVIYPAYGCGLLEGRNSLSSL